MATMKMSKNLVKLVPYSRKQKMLTTWWVKGASPHADKDVIICDGAVRSGKTMVGSMSYIMWAMFNFNYCNFGIAGKSLDSLRRNLWVPLQQWFQDVGIYVVRLSETTNGYVLRYSYYVDKEGNCVSDIGDAEKVIQKENYVFLFGGKDEGSAAYVQGLTAAGMFFDETCLQPESFVNQAVARCSVEGSKLWFNCNPEGPFHWFKLKWVDKLKERNALRIHFSMRDNPSLSEKTLERYHNSWEGVFYQRFVLGEWVAAEGSIYLSFSNNADQFIIRDTKEWLSDHGKRIASVFIGVDWGHNKSANTAVAVGLTEGNEDVVALGEWYTTDPLDPEKLYERHLKFISSIVEEYGYVTVFCDNAEMMLVRGLKSTVEKNKIRASVKPCVKYEIVDRIVMENTLFAQDRIRFFAGCNRLIDGFKTALWDSNTKKDIRLDDGTSNIDSLDAFEYALCSRMRQLLSVGSTNNSEVA